VRAAASPDLVQASPVATSSQVQAPDQVLRAAPPISSHDTSHRAIGVLCVLGVAAAMLYAMSFASPTCNTSGEWDVAGNWSNGVPTASLSAIVSTTGGIPVLPALTSAAAAQVYGGGKVGLCGGNVNKLKLAAQPANQTITFCCVDVMEHNSANSDTPRGHG
jgi:hypothetical protein